MLFRSYQVIPFVNEEEEEELLRLMPHCRTKRWGDAVVDLMSRSGGKENGIRALCAAIGITTEETIAFGDADNDLEMLQLVDMEQYADKYPSELSGGQQQRIGVLRALAASPPIVLMDEPFSALDPMTRETLQDEVKNIQQKLHKTVIFVSHDMGEALKLADVIIFMTGGEIGRAHV